MNSDQTVLCNGKYVLIKEIGKGSFGTVYLAKYKNNQLCAIKIISKNLDKAKLDYLNTEIEIMKLVKHINIIRLYEIFNDNSNFYLVMEYCNGMDLKKYLTKNYKDCKLPEILCRNILKQLAEGMKYYNSKKIIHRDLKLENIMICFDKNQNFPQIKIIDFGISKLKENEIDMAESIVGSPSNMDLIILEALENCNKIEYGFEVDIWGFGIISYNLLFGSKMPFPSTTKKLLIEKYKIGEYLIPINRSLEAIDFINSILQLDLKIRPCIEEILKHPFLTTEIETKIDSIKFKEYICNDSLNASIYKKINFLQNVKNNIENVNIIEINNKISDFNLKPLKEEALKKNSVLKISTEKLIEDKQKGFSNSFPIEMKIKNMNNIEGGRYSFNNNTGDQDNSKQTNTIQSNPLKKTNSNTQAPINYANINFYENKVIKTNYNVHLNKNNNNQLNIQNQINLNNQTPKSKVNNNLFLNQIQQNNVIKTNSNQNVSKGLFSNSNGENYMKTFYPELTTNKNKIQQNNQICFSPNKNLIQTNQNNQIYANNRNSNPQPHKKININNYNTNTNSQYMQTEPTQNIRSNENFNQDFR